MELVNTSDHSSQSRKKIKHVTVLSSVNPAIITVAQSLLNEAGIIYTVTGNGIKTANPGNSAEIYSGLTEIQVIGDENIMAARKILVDLEELEFRDRF